MAPELFALIVGLIAACGLLFAGIGFCSRKSVAPESVELQRLRANPTWQAFCDQAWRAKSSA